jgi:hypothetical protein
MEMSVCQPLRSGGPHNSHAGVCAAPAVIEWHDRRIAFSVNRGRSKDDKDEGGEQAHGHIRAHCMWPAAAYFHTSSGYHAFLEDLILVLVYDLPLNPTHTFATKREICRIERFK